MGRRGAPRRRRWSSPGRAASYRPDPEADWHLLVGDESALPAIAASLEALAAGDRAVVRVVCDGPDHEIELASPADVDLVWLHRHGDERDESLLVAAVGALDFTALDSGSGTPFGFVHGEADEIRAVRRHLLAGARPDPPAALVLAVLATDDDRRGLAPDQA